MCYHSKAEWSSLLCIPNIINALLLVFNYSEYSLLYILCLYDVLKTLWVWLNCLLFLLALAHDTFLLGFAISKLALKFYLTIQIM